MYNTVIACVNKESQKITGFLVYNEYDHLFSFYVVPINDIKDDLSNYDICHDTENCGMFKNVSDLIENGLDLIHPATYDSYTESFKLLNKIIF